MKQEFAGPLAGVASGATKLVVGHPFDTVKVRMQTEGALGRFKGPLDCLLATTRKEGFRGLYKGATPPLVGWMMMDSVMLGTYTNVKLLQQRGDPNTPLMFWQHALAGLCGGTAVSFVACPIEQVKARLQVQYDAATKVYKGPIDCAVKLVKNNGFFGLWRGIASTILMRHWFWLYWGSYDVFQRTFRSWGVSEAMIPFWSGGCASQLFWVGCYPADVVKNRIMAQPDVKPLKYPTVRSAFRDVWVTEGFKGFWRGFVPCILRSFPTNGCAMLSFNFVIKALSDEPNVREDFVVHELVEE
ncbi:mitochondrial carrier [Gonapodya prolifera JEL478]|uniref:Mitochondrial carrier n=1 Tax=Gonapodya prolifera (strain JEL478) TaxID=1344416 RepID=A0A139AFS3_GONPJ|nr:mitochondrial carrier [Gonapodya prolifera JEL478]|eukprot:KXS15637.1 mitochondrial carrier [Gonapodya prolifera JEL478]